MKELCCYNLQGLLRQKLENEEFDSYAIYVKKGEYENEFFSDNVNENTYFDLASCGKILVTSPLIFKAIDEGKIDLNDTLDKFFKYVPADKKFITVKHLLTHTSGIVRHQYANSDRELLIKEILCQPLAFLPGTDYVYSCSGMVLLGFILEKLYQKTLEELFDERIKKPLEYTRSQFNIRVGENNTANCYRYENTGDLSSPWDDENSRVLKTSSGAGGQFFTLSDLKKFSEAVLNKDERLYSKQMFALSEEEHTPKNAKESRGLGWLFVDEKYRQTGDLFSKGSFGHCGHSGQSIFFNREKQLCVIILTNATRFLNKRSGFQGYDYNIVCDMRRAIHNEILKDLLSQGV